MKVAVPLAKIFPLKKISAASAVDTNIQKKIHGSWTATLIISNEEMNDIIKMVQALETPNILSKRVKMKMKNKKEDF